MSIFTLLINKKDVGLCQHFIVFHSKKVTANILQKTKIVCQKCQYEWFFVESVEFCKLNKTQGPTGQQGPIDPKSHKEFSIQCSISPNGTHGPRSSMS